MLFNTFYSITLKAKYLGKKLVSVQMQKNVVSFGCYIQQVGLKWRNTKEITLHSKWHL